MCSRACCKPICCRMDSIWRQHLWIGLKQQQSIYKGPSQAGIFGSMSCGAARGWLWAAVCIFTPCPRSRHSWWFGWKGSRIGCGRNINFPLRHTHHRRRAAVCLNDLLLYRLRCLLRTKGTFFFASFLFPFLMKLSNLTLKALLVFFLSFLSTLRSEVWASKSDSERRECALISTLKSSSIQTSPEGAWIDGLHCCLLDTDGSLHSLGCVFLLDIPQSKWKSLYVFGYPLMEMGAGFQPSSCHEGGQVLDQSWVWNALLAQ